MKIIVLLNVFCLLLASFYSLGKVELNIAQNKYMDLEYIDVGTGEFNIVIESGIGMGVSYWQPVLSELRKLPHRIIIYSRAGIGRSTDSTDVSITRSNQRLHELLTSLKIKNNIVLVGHSYGGLHVREYAVAFSEHITGIVLLDPSHELFSDQLSKLDRAWFERDDIKLNAMMTGSREWAMLQNIYKQGSLSDKGAITTIPTAIVTSSKLGESDWWIGHSAKGKEIWRNLHASLIRKNSNAIHIVSDAVGHNIPVEQPSLVVATISQLIMFVKDGDLLPK
ncbi:alpha/beta fold hydrolase [Pseudoalteromonas aurantia]|uniref:AB hydrolase-1 domain-containing protein n=1 Tax=Pseudoalteromonas aurantia 208 TaxID=1314867 RepID=A0ABR9EC12_9GAMM|nr:alpha/beta hydrolase [Pseudoalteromonas aurantia]MBE0368499.1 hypothetical protein [Pseudoalteromonas aurantia 208]